MTAMTSRSTIFASIDAATATIQTKAPLPDYDVTITQSLPKLEGADLWQIFRRNFTAVNGRTMESIAAMMEFLKTNGYTHGYCDPALFSTIGTQLISSGFGLSTDFDRTRYDDYQFGITRATGAIAESGTLILDDEHTSRRLAALAPWIHVAVLERPEIHRTISAALAALGNNPNIIWCTGPSKTADVEGILIEGVHGPGEQIALLL